MLFESDTRSLSETRSVVCLRPELRFGHFVTKAAVLPQIEKPETVQEAPEQKARKDNKKEKKEKESAGLSPDELKELDDLKQKIIEDVRVACHLHKHIVGRR